ncbi:hypothetical protein HDU96_008648 [Phlyctochytrium bullatum]|nr:hypothetical protein HDU96_008648 [Phlyctochytrium bullatum]
MFFSDALLAGAENSSLAVVWLSSTLGNSKTAIKKLSRKQLNGVDVTKACTFIVSPPEPMALRLSSNLMVGVSRVLGNQYSFLYTDVNQVFLRLKKAFTDLSGGSVQMDNAEASYQAITLSLTKDSELALEESFSQFFSAAMKGDDGTGSLLASTSGKNMPSVSGSSFNVDVEGSLVEEPLQWGAGGSISTGSVLASAKSISLAPNAVRRQPRYKRDLLLDDYEPPTQDKQDQPEVSISLIFDEDFAPAAEPAFEEPMFMPNADQLHDPFHDGDQAVPPSVAVQAAKKFESKKKRKRVHFGDHETQLSNAELASFKTLAENAMLTAELENSRKDSDFTAERLRASDRFNRSSSKLSRQSRSEASLPRGSSPYVGAGAQAPLPIDFPFFAPSDHGHLSTSFDNDMNMDNDAYMPDSKAG